VISEEALAILGLTKDMDILPLKCTIPENILKRSIVRISTYVYDITTLVYGKSTSKTSLPNLQTLQKHSIISMCAFFSQSET